MANLDKLREQYAAATEANRKAYDALNGQFGDEHVKRDYRIAIRNNNKEEIARLKPKYDKLNAEYTKTQQEKNRLKKELDKAETAAKTEKESSAKAKGAEGTYKKSLEELRIAEADLASGAYKAEEKYNAAWLKAQEAHNVITTSGKTPSSPLPQPKVPIKPPKQNTLGGGATGGTGGTNSLDIGLIDPILNELAKDPNALIQTQTFLKDNFPSIYKGGLNGLKDWAATSDALRTINNARNSLPAALKGTDLKTFLQSKDSASLIGATGGTGTGGTKTRAYISSDTEANALVNSVFKAELGRAATDSELSYFKKALKAFQQANPASFDATSQTSAGNSAEYVRQLIAGEAKVKKSNKILESLKKEYTTKQADKYISELDTLQATAKANGLPPLDETKLEEYRSRLKNGESLDKLKQAIRASVANTYSSNKAVADMLNGGQDLNDIYAPYKQTMASILEIPYDKIDLNDPTLTKAIGADSSMPLYQYKQILRQDPRWQYTDNARETVNSGLVKVLKDFGFMG